MQETIIIKIRKTRNTPQKVVITTTQSNCDFSDRTALKAPYDIVVSGEDNYVYLATNTQEIETLEQLNSLENTLPSSRGFYRKTQIIYLSNDLHLKKNIEDCSAVFIWQNTTLNTQQ